MAQLLDIRLFSLVDLDSSIGVGWKLYFYVSGTSTPVDSYPTEAYAIAGTNPNSNPVVVNSDGRLPAIWLNGATKGVLTDENDVVKKTVDPITVDNDVTTELLVHFSCSGTPSSDAFMAGVIVKTAATFPANFTGLTAATTASGHVLTNPSAETTVSITKNDVAAGTATIAIDGSYTFATTGGLAFSVDVDDRLNAVLTGSANSAADFTMVLVAAI